MAIQSITYILGWIGTGLIILAYFLLSFNKVTSDNRTYQWMNLIGAIAIGIHVYYQKAWAAVTLEIIWAMIAIVALIKITVKK